MIRSRLFKNVYLQAEISIIRCRKVEISHCLYPVYNAFRLIIVFFHNRFQIKTHSQLSPIRRTGNPQYRLIIEYGKTGMFTRPAA